MDNKLILNNKPVDVYNALDNQFGNQAWLQWEPETFLHFFPEVNDPIAINKLLAVQAVAANSNLVCRNTRAFEKVVMAFCNNICLTKSIQIPEIEEITFTVYQIEQIIKLVHGDVSVNFTDEIPGYVASVAKYRDWHFIPAILSFARQRLNFIWHTDVNPEAYSAMDNLIEQYRKHGRLLDMVKSLDGAKESEGTQTLLRVAGCYLFVPSS